MCFVSQVGKFFVVDPVKIMECSVDHCLGCCLSFCAWSFLGDLVGGKDNQLYPRLLRLKKDGCLALLQASFDSIFVCDNLLIITCLCFLLECVCNG